MLGALRSYARRHWGRRVGIPESETADLGLAILVAEAGEGLGYEPVGVVGSVREARELSITDYVGRCRRLEGGEDPLCPEHYVLWRRGSSGLYRPLTVFDPSGL
jgi:hypothetical protein